MGGLRLIIAVGCFAIVACGGLAAQTVHNVDALLPPSSTSGCPFNYTSGQITMQTFWTPTQMGNNAGFITEFGLQFTAAVDRTWPSVQIWLGETTKTMATFSTSYAQNFDAAPAVLVFDGPMQVTTTAAGHWRVPLLTPFLYSGVNSLVVEFRVNGVSSGTGTFSHVVQYVQTPGINCRVYSLGSVTATSGTAQYDLGYGASFLILPPGPTLSVDATPGSAQSVYSTAQGPADEGLEVGIFELSANAQGPSVLTHIELEAFGSGDDSIAFT